MKQTGLADFFLSEGIVQPTGSNQPFWVDDPCSVWWLAGGSLDLFLISLLKGESGPRVHFLRAGPGHVIFGLKREPAESELRFLGVGASDARVYRAPRIRLNQLTSEEAHVQAVSEAIDRWIAGVYQQLSHSLLPQRCCRLGREEIVELSPGEAARPQSGVLWVRHLRGRSRLLGIEGLAVGMDGDLLALTPAVWLQAVEPATLRTSDTRSQVVSGDVWSAWPAFDARLRELATLKVRHTAAREHDCFGLRTESRLVAFDKAFARLAEPLCRTKVIEKAISANEDPLVEVGRLLGQALGLNIKLQPSPPGKRLTDGHYRLARSARLRVRRVILKGEWWKQDSGPMLAYLRANNRPVALLPTSSSRYALADPVDQSRATVTRDVAQSLNPIAYTFYRPFRENTPTLAEVFRFGFQGTGPDLRAFLLLSVVSGLLGMALPLATGVVFDTVIPGNYRSQLWFIALALLLAGVCSVIFDLTRDVALLRMEAKSDAALQGAVWDRLLGLPPPFFRSYTAGDLAVRANGINAIQQILSGAAITSLLGGVFSVFNFGLLFWYSLRLAAVASVLVALNICVTLLAAWNSLRLQRKVFEAQGRIAGLVLQFITGISKLRVAGAELRAFAVWATAFGEQKKIDLRLGALGNRMTVFNQSYSLATSICLFAVVAAWAEPGLTTGKFLAFNMAFASFLYAGLAASQGLISLLQAVPVYERAQPILRALPEMREARVDPGELRGGLELSHVSFRYKPNAPLVLSDLSFHVAPGEFVALVGPSGSGKSTIMRLLLGFETPELGTILYDGVDLAGLDVQAIRRQMGVALQNGKLMPGDIFENVVGSGLFTLEEAWEAVRKAGLEEDVSQMPMGMHTVLGEAASTLSAGQRQRLMIARAIVARPRILLFDEATSALDNRTQAIVGKSLKQLQATRLVIAHRLSTIVNADRILVLEEGRLVQQGTYEELVKQPGTFADLVRRQIA